MSDISELVRIMARLRDPQGGCPWDLEQDFHSIAPYTVEEAYEVADAIAREHMDDLREELGDLLFQVVYHARMAQEQGAFSLEQVVQGICDKLVRRHPHVFGDARVADAGAQTRAWEEHKAREKQSRGDAPAGLLDDIPVGMPGLTRAYKLGKRAASVGFDWPDADGPREKVTEELAELDRELERGDPQGVHHEMGDLLFAVVNLCRHHGVDPESALRGTNQRFQQRFGYVEQALAARGETLQDAGLARMDALWDQAKQRLEK